MVNLKQISKVYTLSSQKKPTIMMIVGFMVRHKGFEPLTFAFVVRDSIQLS